MRPNDRNLFFAGENIRVGLYASTHDRLHLEIRKDGVEAVVDLVLCNKVFFVPAWRAGNVKIERFDERLIRVYDGTLDVLCVEASRFDKNGERVFFVNRSSME